MLAHSVDLLKGVAVDDHVKQNWQRQLDAGEEQKQAEKVRVSIFYTVVYYDQENITHDTANQEYNVLHLNRSAFALESTFVELAQFRMEHTDTNKKCNLCKYKYPECNPIS